MTYTYTAGSNKISSISDAANATQGGFRAASGAFTYDNNGNQISNAAKGITSITYNHLNLPINITLSGSRTIDFTYTADGTKLRKVVKTGATINLVQEYVNGIEYRGTTIPATTIEGIYHAEGRLYNNAGTWQREYVIKDHLGDTRIAYCDINNDGVIATPSEILQENNYDAFGYGLDGVYMNHSNPDNLYQYNGKEKNDDHGIGMYDYGARWYDAGVGRWNTVDPMANENNSYSPFLYTGNNPVLMIDPDGQDWIYYDSRGAEIRRIGNDKPNQYYDAVSNKDGTITVSGERSSAPKPAEEYGTYGGIFGRINVSQSAGGAFSSFGANTILKAAELYSTGEIMGWALKPLGGLFGKLFSNTVTMRGSSWVYGAFKTEAKWAGQLSKRGWTAEQITEAVTKGKSFEAVNLVNKANSATRYVHPITGKSVVIDNVTKELLHVGGPGFKY